MIAMPNLTKEQQLMLLGIIASILIGLGVMAFQHYFMRADNNNIMIETPKGEPAALPASEIIVHVSGAVRHEGVYKLKFGDRLLDAVNEAGGAVANADLSAVNLAEAVKDGEKIMVPVKQAAVEVISADQNIGLPAGKVRTSAAPSQKVNINTADQKALDSLPGIGAATAQAIIEYRVKNGPFSRVEQIMEVPRIGQAKFARIKDRIMI